MIHFEEGDVGIWIQLFDGADDCLSFRGVAGAHVDVGSVFC